MDFLIVKEHYFNVYPRTLTNPEALFEYSLDASTVYFTDLSSMINEYDLKYFHWNFGDGNMLTTETGTVDHSYELSGTYEVQLVVENMHGMMSDPYIESITVQANGGRFDARWKYRCFRYCFNG